MKKKIVTLEDLARMVAKGFEETAKKDQFENLDGKVENIEKWAKLRFDNVDRDLENLLAVGNKKR